MAMERSSHIEPDRHMDIDYVASEAESLLPNRSSNNSRQSLITVHILPTTGGEIKLQVSPQSKVSSLKNTISSKIRLHRDKIVLLQKNRQLTEGTLQDNLVTDGARLILVPCVEAGLLTVRPEHSVLKALNSLTDAQVDNVLMGRVPLNLSMRLGGHMMFIQLQLTTASQRKEPANHSSASSKTLHSKSTNKPLHSKLPEKLNLQIPSFMPTPPLTPTTPKTSASFTLPSSPPCSIPTPPSSPETLDPPPTYTLKKVNESEIQSTTIGLGRLKLQHILSTPYAAQNFSSITSGRVATTKPQETVIGNQQYNKLDEASRNLTQTLKQLSSVALDGTSTSPEKCEVCHCSKEKNGAVIESLYHHGKGIYSGTFVGSLSPNLQDRDGRPRQNISTIIHILNDLLGASLNNHPTCKSSSCGSDESVNKTFSKRSSTISNAAPVSPVTDQNLNHENKLIRGKIEQIQTMMEERKQRRKARRNGRNYPYASPLKTIKVHSEDKGTTSFEMQGNKGSLPSTENDETRMEV